MFKDFLSQKTVQELWTPETIGKIKPDQMDIEYGMSSNTLNKLQLMKIIFSKGLGSYTLPG